MNSEHWQRVKREFEALSVLEPVERAATLEEIAREAPEIAAELSSLLVRHDTGDQSLAASLREGAAEVLDDRFVGRRFGAFTITRRIADGGMGSVFEAERDDAFAQRVAIKVLRNPLVGRQAEQRFRVERQILADLGHPFICRLLDGGATEDGYPYLVMELVDGTPVDRYCEERRLSTGARLRLFCRICEAVAFAHRNLVVHRDIKPSNVLVDADGNPKLLDFGIAKLLDPLAAGPSGVETQAAERLMTPEYASPEQVRGGAITIATDVYALGALLYRLLTGRSPHGEPQRWLFELERAILEEPPPRPSAVAAKEREISADLDNIVLMALRKEPEGRYATVVQLAEDVRRFLNREPVLAHPDSFSYRARKFLGRNRVPVSLGVGSAVVIAALTAFYATSVVEQRNRAELEAAKAEEVSGFLLRLFETADPATAKGESVTARALLDRGAERIDAELAEQTETRASLQSVMGGAYLGLGLYESAERLLSAALAAQRADRGASGRDLVATLTRLGRLAVLQGDYEKGEARFRDALAAQRARGLGSDRERAVLLGLLADAVFYQGRPEESEPVFREALALVDRAGPDAGREKAAILNAFGWALLYQGAFERAEAMLQEAVALYTATVGRMHPDTAEAMYHLNYVYADTGRWDEARAWIEESLRITRQVLGQEHPEVATRLWALGWILENEGAPAEAEGLYREALALSVAIGDPLHPYVALSKNNLAGALRGRGAFPEAAALLADALELNRTVRGPDHPETATSAANLADVLVELGRFDEARRLYEKALEIRRGQLGATHAFTLSTEVDLAILLNAVEEYEASGARFGRAIEQLRRTLGDGHEQVAAALVEYGRLLRHEGRPDAAREAVLEGLAAFEARASGSRAGVANARYVLASIDRDTGAYEEAERGFRDAVAGFRLAYPPGHPALAPPLVSWAEALLEDGRPEQALPLLEEALAIEEAALPPGHWRLGVTRSVLGSCHGALGRTSAAELLTSGRDLLLATRGEASRATMEATERLRRFRRARDSR